MKKRIKAVDNGKFVQFTKMGSDASTVVYENVGGALGALSHGDYWIYDMNGKKLKTGNFVKEGYGDSHTFACRC